MYYDGTPGGGQSTGLSYSADGITWNGYDADADGYADPVLQGSGSGWDTNYASGWTIIKNAPDDFVMWYSGGDGKVDHGIGYATSSDGINWTKDENNPVYYNDDGITWRDNRTYTPSVIKDGANYKMWFTGKDGTSGTIPSVMPQVRHHHHHRLRNGSIRLVAVIVMMETLRELPT